MKKINQMKGLPLLFSGMRGLWRWFLLTIAATLLAVLLSFISPQVVRVVVDSVLGELPFQLPAFLLDAVRDIGGREYLREHLWLCAAAVTLITGLSALFFHIRTRSAARLSEGLSYNLKRSLFGHIQRLPFGWHVQVQTGDIMQRCSSDVETVRGFMAGQFVEVARILMMLIVAFSLMFRIHTGLSLAALAFLPVVVLYSSVFYSLIGRYFKEADEAEGALSALTQENLTGVRVVRAFGRESYEMDRFREQNGTFSRLWIRTGRLLAVYWSLGDFLSTLQTVVVLTLGAVEAVAGRITVGDLIVFVTYTGMLAWPVRSLGRTLGEMSKAGVSVDRLSEILSAQPETDEPGELTPPVRGRIEFRDVSFSYGGSPVLNGVSFTVEPGETLAILGATGSGKSTLVSLLCRLYDLPEGSGEILLDGTDIRKINRKYLRKNIGLVLQEPFLFSRTLRENLSTVRPEATEKELLAAATVAAVHESVMSFTKGYDTMVGERGVTLSGGQKQRVAIARTLLTGAPILVLDDSLSAVDAQTDHEIRHALRSRRKGTTAILIAHRIITLMEADRILVLHHGRVAELGTHEELLRLGGIYKRIHDIQGLLSEELLEEGGMEGCADA